MDVADQPRRVLQLRDIDVQIHPVDTVHLELHVFGQDIADRPRYGHHGLRTETGRPAGQLTAITVHTPDRSAGHGLTRRPEPPNCGDQGHASSGWGGAPLAVLTRGSRRRKFESARSNRRRIRRVDGVHDLGGLDGFGPVEHTPAEPLFEQDWERRVFRVLIGSMGWMGGAGGRFRHSIERMAPEHYLSSPYYEHWLTSVATLAVESGITTPDELEHRAGGRFPLSRADRGVLPDDLTPRTQPRYSIGDE